MHSFNLVGIGNLASQPTVQSKGDTTYTRFCLIANDSGATTRLWFVAFGALGESLATHARKGDQIIVEAHVEARTWTDKEGKKRHDQAYVLAGFRFGAPGKATRG